MITTFILVYTQNQICAFLPGAPKLDPKVQLTPPCVQLWREGQSELGSRAIGGSGVEGEVKRVQLFAFTDVHQAKGGKVDRDGLTK